MPNVRSLLEALLRFPTVTPHDEGCLDFVADRLRFADFRVEMIEHEGVRNLWATHGTGAPLVCFAGHTDVVPTGPLSSWTSPPFEPTEREGYLYGRGASDMKASDAAIIVALDEVAREGHPGTVAILLTGDEEGPGVWGTRYVLDQLSARGVKIDAAIVGEPTSEEVFGDVMKVGRRGSAHGTLRVKGVQGHTAYPQLARNAAHLAAPALLALTQLEWGHGTDVFPPTTLQVSNLTSGTGAGNVIPGEAEIRFNVRFGTDWTPEAIERHVAQALAAAGEYDPVHWDFGILPFVTSPGPLLDAITAAVRAELGVEPRASTGGGTSDARFFAAHRIPVAEFGPINATIHAIDENVEIACLEPLARIYMQIARRLLA